MFSPLLKTGSRSGNWWVTVTDDVDGSGYGGGGGGDDDDDNDVGSVCDGVVQNLIVITCWY